MPSTDLILRLNWAECVCVNLSGKGWLFSCFPLAHRRFIPSQCRALPGTGTETQEQPHLKPSLHTPTAAYTPTPDTSAYWSHALHRALIHSKWGQCQGASSTCSGSLWMARSPNQDGTAPFGWLWASPRRACGLWSMVSML